MDDQHMMSEEGWRALEREWKGNVVMKGGCEDRVMTAEVGNALERGTVKNVCARWGALVGNSFSVLTYPYGNILQALVARACTRWHVKLLLVLKEHEECLVLSECIKTKLKFYSSKSGEGFVFPSKVETLLLLPMFG